ncbi:cytochrome P450 [Novosphingobium sp. KCTC 2891]|uniref:cytochrome P450 n=1 Tax=Novosphingobium sp. KCTC 2891 TaxID=2989730 RepID=UPI0022229629|nr:cytochrome P450 [Novosphingobium sp. KCTC 2891]MCW1384904.1 cytochrome P450 [Novosphingobium sp. KCTC 2891]
MTVADMTENLLDPGLFPAEQGPPHHLFDKWRATDPVHWNPPNPHYVNAMPGSSGVKGFWVLTRYKDVYDVSMNQELFSSHENGIVVWDFEGEGLERQRANFMSMKPADHTAVKKVIMPPFMPKALNEIAPQIERLAAEIIDSVASRGHCEFVFDVASRLPIATFCELMGIPEHYRNQVADYGNALADVESRSTHSLDPTIGLFGIAQELAAEKRRNPDGRLLSAMVNDTTLNLDPMAINQFFLVFAMAGHETTRSTAVHFINLMNRFPDQYALLRSDFDAHIDNAIDEVLRYTSTTTNFTRTALADTEIGGHPVRKGDKIYMSYAAANRDPAMFQDPHRFDITRENAKRHLAFGAGPHICVGARLAKMQLRALLAQIVSRIPDIHPVGEPEWLRSVWFNAIIRMPVEFTPELA